MLDNPAGRLLALLEEGKRFDKKNTQTIEAWAQLFGEDTSEIATVLPDVLAQLGKVMALPSEIRTRVEAQGFDPEVYLERHCCVD